MMMLMWFVGVFIFSVRAWYSQGTPDLGTVFSSRKGYNRSILIFALKDVKYVGIIVSRRWYDPVVPRLARG